MRKLVILRMHKVILVVLTSLVMSGCQTNGPLNPLVGDAAQCRVTPANIKLNYGVLSYEEGNYQASVTALQGVLDTKFSGKPEQVKAYKYLAFIQCVSGREAICRDYFKRALEIDPNFTLDPAEAGHPMWGPVFQSFKSKSTK